MRVLRSLRRVSGGAGYTLIEMMVVLFIITLLGSLILAGLSAARRHSQVQRAEFALRMLENKINEYETDFHDYPPSDGDDAITRAESLLTALLTRERAGPYLSLNDIQTCDENQNGIKEISDPWGHAFRYLHHRNYARENPNRRTYRLYSLGPDNIEDPFNPESDDLTNWKKGHEADADE